MRLLQCLPSAHHILLITSFAAFWLNSPLNPIDFPTEEEVIAYISSSFYFVITISSPPSSLSCLLRLFIRLK
nr:MAG TPA: hypothetical protein [Caudoviricetes sp.]